MAEVFCCPACRGGLTGWPPSRNCLSCGKVVPVTEGVFVFTDDPDLNLKGERPYVGYDFIAGSYAEYQYAPDLEKKIHVGYGKAMAELLEAGKLILDVGAGPGKSDIEIAKNGYRVIAGDISFNMLRILSARLDKRQAEWVIPCRLNAYELPLTNRSVDAVMAIQFLHFVGDPASVVGEIKRVLRPGGLFIVNGSVETSPKDDLVSEIRGKARAYYGQVLMRIGARELRLSGGWPTREIRGNLSSSFRNFRNVRSEHLTFRYVKNAGWFLARLGSRYTAFQLGFDQKAHGEAMQEVRQRLTLEYGEGFEEIEQEYCSVHQLNIYSEGRHTI